MYSISIYYDTRRKTKDSKYPVKLRVFTPTPRKQKFYPTEFYLTEQEISDIQNLKKPRARIKDLKLKINALEKHADDVAKNIIPFNFEHFEKKLYKNKNTFIKPIYHYRQTIEQLENENRISTASNYDLSEKSIISYIGSKAYEHLTFFDITPKWLQGYENYMTQQGKSLTTVSIYLRALRTIFNIAIFENDIEKDCYPFSRTKRDKKYQIPNTNKVKKALSNTELSTLFNAEPKTPEQCKAKDFWFFSYACNGINTKDIANLKFKDLDSDKFTFYRAKTLTTSKANLTPITVYLNDFSKAIIDKYGNKNTDPENYVFSIINSYQNPKEQHKSINNFNRFVSQNLQVLCKQICLPKVSFYWARHSFATNAVRKGASLEFMQEALGHNNIKTTQNYFAGFENETKKELALSIMDF